MVNPRKAYNYFRSHFPMRRSSQNWWSFDCPFCVGDPGKKKMAVHFDYEMVKCWVCEYREMLLDFVKDFEGITYYEARELIRNQEEVVVDAELLDAVPMRTVESIGLPFGFVPILDGTGMLGVRARNYLTGRGFMLDELDRLGIGYCNEHAENPKEDYFGYIIIPFKNKGVLQYFIGRDYTGNYLRYKNPDKTLTGVGKADLLFNEDALGMRKVCYVTEGWTDALTMGDSGVSTQGWSLSTRQKSLMLRGSCKRLVFVADKGFYKQAVHTAMPFLDHKEVFVVSLEDAEGGKDANEVGRDYVMDCYHQTEQLTFEYAIREIV